MAFRFSFQPLLRLRRSLESREQLRLETIVKEVLRARQELERAEQENRAASQRLAAAMLHGMKGVELHFEQVCAAARQQIAEQLRSKLEELERLRAAQLAVLQKARQDREILESLRRRQYELYRQVHSRREQQQIDELFLMGRASRSR